MRLFRRRRIRSRNWFVIVVIIIAVIAVLGALLAYYLLVKKPDVRLAPPPPPPPPPQQVDPFQSRPIQAWDEPDDDDEPVRRTRTRPRSKPRPESLDDSAIRSTMRRLGEAFNRCAREHGGVDGSEVRVGFSVSADGSVDNAFALAPYSSTPLGRCVTNVVAGARFGRSEFGRGDVRWSIKLHP